jgi:ADP-ribose pyrophosphatase YjhB (NUDIX family)
MISASVALSSTKLASPPCCTPITAGIICFSVAPSTKNIFLLLGLEDKQKQWADFGGAINPGESVEFAAAREFSEESLCAIDLSSSRVPFEDYEETIRKTLYDGNYFMRLDLVHNTVDNVDNIRVYYIIQIPWSPYVKSRFADVRDRLLGRLELDDETNLHPAIKSREPLKVDEHWLEKSQIKWWSVERLKGVLKNNGKFRDSRFRQSFLRVLDVILTQLDDFCPSHDPTC